MNPALEEIPNRIVVNALGALMQANTQAVFSDPGMEHRDQMCIVSAALAGELFLKAIIARAHPLLIFRDLFQLDQPGSTEFDVEKLITSGKTYAFEHLPRLLWVATGERVPDLQLFNKVRSARNAVQHFCPPHGINLRHLSLSFIYRIIDPLIRKHFGLFAIDYHEDSSVGYDHVVARLIRHELEFSIPEDFRISEINLNLEIAETSPEYRSQFGRKLLRAAEKRLDR